MKDRLEEFSYHMHSFDRIAENELGKFIEQIDDSEYIKAAQIILQTLEKGGRIHVTGIGKPSHVAVYAASLLSSTGTPAYFLHGTEAVHGSCGQLVEGDTVICISNSGETSELMTTVEAVINNGCRIISITGNRGSRIAQRGEIHLFAGVEREGGELNRAPRVSILAECFVIQRLSALLQAYRRLTVPEYIRRHPGGALGNLRENEK